MPFAIMVLAILTVDLGAITRLISYIFRVIYESSTSVKFYINGRLMTTITTNCPTGSESFIYLKLFSW